MTHDFASWQRRYGEALRLLGTDATSADALDRADALWLARVLPAPPAVEPQTPTETEPAQSEPDASPDDASHPAASPPASGSTAPTQPDASGAVPLFAAQPGTSGETQLKARRVRVPGSDALPGRAAMERALKPFLRRRPSRRHRVIDAVATAEASASASAELLAAGAGMHVTVPVLQAVPERWFDVALLAENDDAMLAFEDTVLKFRELLAHHGAFGQVGLWRFQPRERGVVVQTRAGVPCGPRSLLQAHRPQLVLLLTHGASPHWGRPALREFVRDLAQRSLVSIVQMLPSRSWSFTTLGEARERVRSTIPGAPTRVLERLDLWSGLYARNGDAAAVPVFPLEPQGTSEWARWVMTARRQDHFAVGLDAMAESMPPGATPETVPDEQEHSPRERVLRFRNVASASAFALLRLLAASWITLPVMRLFAQSLPGPRSAAPVAEVLLSGLLIRQSPAGTPAHELVFEFVPGVREWLHGSLSSGEQRQANAAMAASRESIRRFVEEKSGVTVASFDALLLDPQGTDLLPASARSFVEVSKTLQALRGSPVDSAPATPPPVVARSMGALHGFPLMARNLIPRPELDATILRRILDVPLGGRDTLKALARSGARMLLARLLAHPQVRQRFDGGIWMGTEPPLDARPTGARLFVRTNKSAVTRAGDTVIDLRWYARHPAPDIGFIPPAEAEAWLKGLGIPATRARRLLPLHQGVPQLLQLVGVATMRGISGWPPVRKGGHDARFDAYVRTLLKHSEPAEAEGLMMMAARRPGYPVPTPVAGVELAAALGWLCSDIGGAASVLHPTIAKRLESAMAGPAAEAHGVIVRELRSKRLEPKVAEYARAQLLQHAKAAGGRSSVHRVLLDRSWLAVLLEGGVDALLATLAPLVTDDRELAAFATELDRSASAYPADPPATNPALLDSARARFAPEASWRTRMGIDEAHRAQITGAGVRVALVATGIDPDHPELQHLVVAGEPVDENGHGTAVASVIAGRFIGVAPGATIWSLAALDSQGRGTPATLLKAFDTIAEAPASERPDIVCMPLGFKTASEVMQDAMNVLAERGILLIAAAGNDGAAAMAFPAALTHVMSVGALATGGTPAAFSNQSADKPDLWAPGTDIDVAVAADGRARFGGSRSSSMAGKDSESPLYVQQSGTSFSCAAVAGLAALYAEATGLRGASLGDVLLRTARDKQARFVSAAVPPERRSS